MEAIDKIKTNVVGVDIGMEKTTYAIVDIRGNILKEDAFNTLDYPDVNEFAAALSERIMVLAESACGYENIRSVGIGAPSSNFLTGCIEHAANLHWGGQVPLAAMLRDRLGLAVALANDCHAAALGERAFGSAHGMRDFIVISLGHGGVGSCIFSNGLPHLGEQGFAGEVGHCCMVEDGRQCGCGRKGCLETYVSVRGIMKTAREMMAEGEATLLDEKTLTIDTIIDASEKGDTIAQKAIAKTGEILGLALANYASLLNPEAIILTGEMTRLGNLLLEPTRKTIDEHVFHNIRGRVKLLVSTLDNRDVLGASALAWDVKEYSLFK